MISKTIFLTFLISIFFNCNSFAEVCSIKTSEGKGEAIATCAWQELEKLVQPCLSNIKRCQISDAEKALVLTTVQTMPDERKGAGLDFINPQSDEALPPYQTAPQVGALVEINSADLYSTSGVVQPVCKISSYVLAAVMSHHSRLPQASLLKLAISATKDCLLTVTLL